MMQIKSLYMEEFIGLFSLFPCKGTILATSAMVSLHIKLLYQYMAYAKINFLDSVFFCD